MADETIRGDVDAAGVQRLLEGVSGGCLALDTHLHVIAASQEAFALLGKSASEIGLGIVSWLPALKSHLDVFQTDGRDREAVCGGGEEGTEIYRIRSRWVELNAYGIHLVSFPGNPKLDEELNWFRLAVEASPVGMLLVDSRGKIVFANRETERIFGYQMEELFGQSMEILLPHRFRSRHEGHRSGYHAEPTARSMGLGMDLFGLHKDGQEIPVEIGLNPLKRDGSSFVLASIVDITHRKRMEAKLIQTQKLEGLGVLAGGIAHDFNNILMGIQGYAELVRLVLQPESSAASHLASILAGAKRGGELVHQMLAYAGKSKTTRDRIRLDSLVEGMAHFLEVSISKRAVLDLKIDALLPEVEGDPTQIRQIVMNLIVNASDALRGEPGMISIRVGCVEDGQLEANIQPGFEMTARRYVYLEVKDNGCGISEEALKKIFDPFFTTKATGRGLGLAAVLGIVRGHGGALGLESKPGEGTSFRVYFPAVEDDARGEAPVTPTESTSVRASGTVLVVDDEKDVRTVASAMLELMGFKVIQAEDGLDAVERFQEAKDKVRFVLLDMTMPKLDGLGAFQLLKKKDPELKVILSSGFGEPEVLDMSPQTGFAAFLRKPYSFADLCHLVETKIVV